MKQYKEKISSSQGNRMRLRKTVLQHYGGQKPKCDCCGEGHYEFLAIDHIHGGGSQHKKETGCNIYGWLKRNGFPPGYRVLCHNCNQSLGLYGYCPHHTNSREIPPSLTEKTREEVLRAAIEISSLGIYPSLPKVAERCGHQSTLCGKHRKALIKSNRWPMLKETLENIEKYQHGSRPRSKA